LVFVPAKLERWEYGYRYNVINREQYFPSAEKATSPDGEGFEYKPHGQDLPQQSSSGGGGMKGPPFYLCVCLVFILMVREAKAERHLFIFWSKSHQRCTTK
jgi:hypothetical protein